MDSKGHSLAVVSGGAGRVPLAAPGMLDGERVTERYQVLRRIGAGGMGVVYEAEDRERGQRVALKTIAEPDVEQIYKLKREFRLLADLSHPNLVTLYDLVVDRGSCFFTMELLDGEDLLGYLWHREGRAAGLAHDATATLEPDEIASARAVLAEAPTNDGSPIDSPCDFERLRAVLPQLARGLQALHSAGKIHRDVKPSNIRITSAGRAVLLDFGLAAEVERRRGGDDAGLLVGTVGYMAPEQCAGELALTPAVDWYALGVVLYQAMTGRLPFEGPLARVVLDKQVEQAAPPSRRARGIPADLDALCHELLQREPGERPGGRALLRRLGVHDDDTGVLHVPSLSRDRSFAGRQAELEQLDGTLAALEEQRASVAVIRGPSGMGKTALVGRFLDRLRAEHDDLLILNGRCFDREDVPYKAIDDLIDELSDWWLEQTPTEAQAIVPRDACLLPTLFPMLGRVPVVSYAPTTRRVADPQELRTHAFAALRETLQRLSDRRRLVLVLDDMQWVDRDTTALLADLMRAPDPPPLLLVLATRVEGSEAVLELVRRMDADCTVVDVGPLDEDVAVALAQAQLGQGSEGIARRLVDEAAGSPFFLIELTRYLQGRSLDEIAGKGLDAMLSERIDELGQSARVVAEVVTVAGEPLTRGLIARATELPPAEVSRQLSHLRAQRIVRTSGARSDDAIEPYHDRIREVMLRGLPGDRRASHHRSLATALSGQGTAEQLARHWYGAGDRDRAADHARRAGDEARAKLDFDRAARFYTVALNGSGWSSDERRALRRQLGDSLADAGRPREAAEQFEAAAAGSDASTALELRRRAAGALLQSGHIAEGLALTRTVLSGVGLQMSATPRRALASLLARRAWLRARGLGFQPRSLAQISQAQLTRVDVCEGVSFGLALVDTFHSMDFATRFLQEALSLGEPWRVSRALALEADLLAATYQRDRALRLLSRLEELTDRIGTPQADAQLLTTRGLFEFFLHNRLRRAYDILTEAIALFRAVENRAGFELDTVNLFCCWSLYYLGEVGELSRRVPAMAEAAARAGNLYTSVTLRCAFPVAWLARLAPEAIEAEMDAALKSWTAPDGSYQLQHLLALCSRIDLALYRGRPEAATARIAADRKPMARSMIDRPPMHALLLSAALARHAIACAATAPGDSNERRTWAAEARQHVRQLAKAPMPLSRACSQMLEGALLEVEGRMDGARAAYERCLPALESSDTYLYAHAVRYRLSRLRPDGAEAREQALAWLTREGVREPHRMLAMLLPGGD